MATKLSITLDQGIMNELLVSFGVSSIFCCCCCCNYWPLSHIMCLQSHWISGIKITLTEEQTIGTFCGQIKFSFLFFFPDCAL